jgi:transcriptional regulator with XRE-family HTH domain
VALVATGSLGSFLTELLYERRISNRALAAGAGVSEGVIRNLLQHGEASNAKDPEPRTLRAVADFLKIDALKLFRLAGYLELPLPYSVRAEYLAGLFDKMPPDRQLAMLHVAEALAEGYEENEQLKGVYEHPEDPLGGIPFAYAKGYSPFAKVQANFVLTGGKYPDAHSLDEIDPEAFVWPGHKFAELPPERQQLVRRLILAKLALDFDRSLKGFE